MQIRSLKEKDRAGLLALLIKTRSFTPAEVDVAMELIDIALSDPGQKDYEIQCMVEDSEKIVGYICYGPVPMTQGAFDLYWVAVDPDFQKHGIGSKMMDFLVEKVARLQGRIILADTSTIPHYEKTRSYYLKNGFEEVARISDYYHPGNDRVTFYKRLSEK